MSTDTESASELADRGASAVKLVLGAIALVCLAIGLAASQRIGIAAHIGDEHIHVIARALLVAGAANAAGVFLWDWLVAVLTRLATGD